MKVKAMKVKAKKKMKVMKKRKKKEDAPATEAAPPATQPPPGAPEMPTQPYFRPPDFAAVPPAGEPAWDGPTRAEQASELAALAAQSASDDGEATEPVDSAARLESIVESLLFASDRPLTLAELKRFLGERDGKKVTAALEALRARREESGVQLASVAGGWQLRTHPANAAWVAKLVAGKPQRLTRAMLETLSIVAYRQPVTRPEIDQIRGVDCGPVLHTLLDRGLVRMIGKKEEVGRPILYGTTPEFLRTFSLSDLAELPTLREFHELSEAEMAKVDAHAEEQARASGSGEGAAPVPAAPPLAQNDPDEDDRLLADLERATSAAAKAAAEPPETNPEPVASEGPDPS
jgi:segregation and condensation protein B